MRQNFISNNTWTVNNINVMARVMINTWHVDLWWQYSWEHFKAKWQPHYIHYVKKNTDRERQYVLPNINNIQGSKWLDYLKSHVYNQEAQQNNSNNYGSESSNHPFSCCKSDFRRYRCFSANARTHTYTHNNRLTKI